MRVMTAAPPLPFATDPAATLVGEAAALVEDVDGGRVFLHGNLVYAWAPGEDALRRWSAVQLVRLKAAPVAEVADAFGVGPGTLWRWGQTLTESGVAALASDRRGPKGPHRLTPPVLARIHARAAEGATQTVIAAELGVSTTTVRRALAMPAPATETVTSDGEALTMLAGADAEGRQPGNAQAGPAAPVPAGPGPVTPVTPLLPVLPPAVDRTSERVAARFGLISHATPVFTPAARVPLAGLLLALPGLEATGLLDCAGRVFGALPNGFYGLDTVLLEAVLRTLAGQPRAEGATRVDPTALGRVLGLDRAPEVKTIRRKLGLLAATGKATELVTALAATHLARPDTTTGDTINSPAAEGTDGGGVGMVLYVDGHVRAYQGSRKIGKTHLARLRFPAPATLETWVSDAAGDPVLVVMAEPGASLASELRRLIPTLRAAVGDDRRVLVGFDRGGWSPALFKYLHEHGFDVLTWRKGPTRDIDPALFTDVTFTDDTGRDHAWRVADTTTTLPLPKTTTDQTPGPTPVFGMRQVTLAVPPTKHHRKQPNSPNTGDTRNTDTDTGSTVSDGAAAGPRQIHILTTRTDLPAAQVIHRMGSRWRQENYFRYARMHFDLDSHDSYTITPDDPDRSVPNPARKHTYQQVLAARTRHQQQTAATNAAMLAARTPPPGTQTILLTNQTHNALTADLHAAEAALTQAEAVHEATPARLPLKDVNPGQQVLDVQTKLLTHAIRMAAFNTATTLTRQLRLHTGYARKNDEAHALIRQTLTSSGDIDPTTQGVLTIRLEPLPTRRATTAIAQLCQHLTSTQTRYPGTDLLLRYEIKTAP